MRPLLKPVETFRDDFTYTNSPEAVARFPFPFPEDEYMYSVNLEPAAGGEPGSVFEHWFDVDEHYLWRNGASCWRKTPAVAAYCRTCRQRSGTRSK